jgi:energy-coupling factor transporter ATP-binding protein EcfA2
MDLQTPSVERTDLFLKGLGIKCLSVQRLFGQYNYELKDRASAKDSASRLLLLYGENGSGKTTILRTLFFLLSHLDKRGHKSQVQKLRAEDVIHELRMLLEESFLIRIACEDLSLLHAGFPPSNAFCSSRKGAFRFRPTDYVEKVFSSCRDKSWRVPLERRVSELKQRLSDDPRKQIHGHDFRVTLAWYIRQHPGYAAFNADTISAMLLGFIDFEGIATEPLFVELVRRLTLS